jgi:hypothetical protein
MLVKLPNGRCDIKFTSIPKKVSRVERFNFKKSYYNLYIDKNNQIYDIKDVEVLSWKINKNKKRVPDEVKESRNMYFFDRIKGNPRDIAVNKILAKLEYDLAN